MISIPDLDIRTWIALGACGVLVATILAVPELRSSLAAWLVWFGALLGGAESERRARKEQGVAGDVPDRPDPDDIEPTTDVKDLADEIEQADQSVDEMSKDELREAIDEEVFDG